MRGAGIVADSLPEREWQETLGQGSWTCFGRRYAASLCLDERRG